MGDERAETYLRVLAESELRRAGERLRALDAAAGTDLWSRPDMSLFATVEGAQWKVVRTARILVAAGVLDQECLVAVANELYAAIKNLRVLAEAELRRVSSRLRLLDAAAGTDVWSPPDSSLFVTAERAQWKVGRTGRILRRGRRARPGSPLRRDGSFCSTPSRSGHGSC